MEEKESKKETEEKKKVNYKEDPLYESTLSSLQDMGFIDYHIDLGIEGCNFNLANQEEIMNWMLENPLPDNWEEEKLKKDQENENQIQSNQLSTQNKKVKYRRIPIRLQQLFSQLQLADESNINASNCSPIASMFLFVSFVFAIPSAI